MTIVDELLEEGNKLFKEQKYEAAEKKYVEGLKLTGDKYKLQLPFIIGLGNVYSQKSMNVNLLQNEDRIKATIAAIALYNYALRLMEKSDDDISVNNQLQKQFIKNEIYTTNINFLKNSGVNINANINNIELELYCEKGDLHRNNLLKLRNEIKKEFKEITQDDLLSHKIELQQQNTKKIKNIYAKIATEIQKIIIGMFEECRSELTQVLKISPSSDDFAIIGFGSCGRKEMTPYSDFEWGILIKDDENKEQSKIEEYKNYFRTLAALMQIKIINLGETILPAIGIKPLNDYYNSDNQNREDIDWFYDGVMPRGFSFDGAMPEACMLPPGCPGRSNGVGKFELIGTIYDFDKLLKRTDVREYFALELMENTFVYGNEKLFESYKERVKKYVYDNSNTWKQKCLKVILGDIKKYLPDFSPQEIEGKFFHAKKDIYRLTDRIFSDIASYYGIDNRNALDVINELKKKKVINDEVAQCLENAITIAWWFRLKTYLTFERQKDVISIFEIKTHKRKKDKEDKEDKEDKTEDKEEKIIEQETNSQEIQLNYQLDNCCNVQKPTLVIKGKIKKILFKLFYTLLPWYGHLNSLAFSLPNSTNENTLQENFFPQFLYDDSDKNKGIVCKRLLDYPQAIKYLEKYLEKYKGDVQCMGLLNMIYYEDAQSQKVSSKKLETYDLSPKIFEEKIILIGDFLNTGIVRCNQGYYDQSIECLKQSLEYVNKYIYSGKNELLNQLLPIVKNIISLMSVTNPAIFREYVNKVGIQNACFALIQKPQLSFKNISGYIQSISKIKESLITSKIVADVSVQVIVVLRQISKAILHEAREISKKQISRAQWLLWLSNELLQLAVILCKKTCINLIDFAETLNVLGLTFFYCAKNSQLFPDADEAYFSESIQKAETYFWKAIQMAEKYYEGEPNKRSGLYYGNLGMIYKEQRKIDEAIFYYKKSYAIQKAIYVNNPNHPDFVRPLYNLALLYFIEKSHPKKIHKYFIKYLNCRDEDPDHEKHTLDAIHYLVDRILYNSENGNYEKAIKLCEEFLATDAIKQYINGQKQDHTSTKEIVRMVAYMRGVLCRWYHTCFCQENDNQYIDKIERSFQEITNEKAESIYFYRQKINIYVEYSVYLYQQKKFEMAISNLEIALGDETGGNICYTNSEKILLDDDLQKCINKQSKINLSANMLACYLIAKCYEKLNYSKLPKPEVLQKFKQEIEVAIKTYKMKQAQPILFSLLCSTYKKFNPPAFSQPLPSSAAAFENLWSNTKLDNSKKNNTKKTLFDITINFFNNKNMFNTKCAEDGDEKKQIIS